MKKDYKTLLRAAATKTMASINLVEASLSGLAEYEINEAYTPKQLEPYDALSDRFIRAVETSIKFFKTYEYYLNAVSSDSFRDLLLNMEKLKIISSVGIWIDMRDIRNRIVHDYLPKQIKEIYDLIMDEFRNELLTVKQKIEIDKLDKI